MTSRTLNLSLQVDSDLRAIKWLGYTATADGKTKELVRALTILIGK